MRLDALRLTRSAKVVSIGAGVLARLRLARRAEIVRVGGGDRGMRRLRPMRRTEAVRIGGADSSGRRTIGSGGGGGGGGVRVVSILLWANWRRRRMLAAFVSLQAFTLTKLFI